MPPPAPPPSRDQVFSNPSKRVSTASDRAVAKAIFNDRVRMSANKDAQCTHITVTRLYTQELRCSSCHCQPAGGWLFRCTQDRELMLENDLELGFQDRLDKMFGIGGKHPNRAGGPAARSKPLSFLNELPDGLVDTYSARQLADVLRHRSDAQKTAILDKQSQRGLNDQLLDTHPDVDSRSPPGTQLDSRPWLPFKGKECQYKCCPSCRPTLVERSFLSLDGIVNGDIPATAITGFGFHIAGETRVSLVKHVKNLGLRPNPSSHRPPPVPSQSQSQSKTAREPERPDSRVRSEDLLMMSPITQLSPTNPYHTVRVSAQAHLAAFQAGKSDLAGHENQNSASVTASPTMQSTSRSPLPRSKNSLGYISASPSDSSSRPLPSPLRPTTFYTGHRVQYSIVHQLATLTPLPPQTAAEMVLLDEDCDLGDGLFGSQLLHEESGNTVDEVEMFRIPGAFEDGPITQI